LIKGAEVSASVPKMNTTLLSKMYIFAINIGP